jgi:hypothetical protein
VYGQDKSSLPLPPSGNVTLPLDEYNRLVELAGKPAKKTDTPPLPYALKRADMKLHVANDSVLGSVQLEGEVFTKGTAKVPLTQGLTVLDARQTGKTLPLEQDGGKHTAVLSGPADFSVALDIGISLSIEAGRASFDLPVPLAGSARLSLEIPGDHTNVRISPGLITGRTSEGGRTVIEATLMPGQTTAIWWATREIAAPVAAREVRFLSEVKTLVSVGEADLRLAILSDLTVLQGESSEFEAAIPAGYELTGATGASLESAEVKAGSLILRISGASRRSHQFLISMEKPIAGAKAEIPFMSFKGSQRETGEVLVEGVGAMELTATEGGALKRMDLKETDAYLRSLARHPLHAAFRYHRQTNEPPGLTLAWNRFPDSSVLAAVAESAIVTTLITSEGRSLTEVKLIVKNQAQPFLKVALPSGASILTAEVAGEKVKPVLGTDGGRVPLLTPGFRPSGPYTVAFVFIHAGAPFAKKGDSELSLPKMDVPINLLEWEVFLPELYKVRDFGGDVISSNLLPPSAAGIGFGDEEYRRIAVGSSAAGRAGSLVPLFAGQLGGLIVDPSGSGVPGVKVTVTHTETGTTVPTITDERGRWIVSSVPSGSVRIAADYPGFKRSVHEIVYDAGRPSRYNFAMNMASVDETVTVASGSLDASESQRIERAARKNAPAAVNSASTNVLSLQRRVAGVLPIRVDVPRAGNSYRFVRPLVLDEETKVTFNYKAR